MPLDDKGLPPPAPGWRVVGVGDFNRDGMSDLAWRRIDDTGEVRIWLLDGTKPPGNDMLLDDKGLPPPDPGWRVIGVGDFHRDGMSDLAWRRIDDTGEVRIWLLDGTKPPGNDMLLDDKGLPPPDPGWRVIGVGDFNRDGMSALAWRRIDDTGEVRIWLLDGTKPPGNDMLLDDKGLPPPDPGWRVIGVGDFNRDGMSDLAWRRIDDTGEVRIWLLDGTKPPGNDMLLDDKGLPPPAPGWRVVGVGDFNRDGMSDLAWRRIDDTGEDRIWLLDGTKPPGNDMLLDDKGLPPPDPGWRVIGVGDFHRDGMSDLAWRRIDDTGEVRIWLLDGTKPPGNDMLLDDKGLPPPAPGWRVVGVGDFNRDGMSDLAWRRIDDTGEVRIWLLDGTKPPGNDMLLDDKGLPPPDPGWRVIGVGDFNRDGMSDLAWRRIDDTGEVRIWLLD